MKITQGSLFTGIGGFDLGFEKQGIETLWQVEILPFCLQVLAKNFPNTERFTDVKEVGKNNLKFVDVITGGFPCQDISQAGLQAGIKNGTRSGLWFEYKRIIDEMRPQFVVIENVSRLVKNGLQQVLTDLTEIGYDAEWTCIRASDVGAPHRRERVWIVAYPNTRGWDATFFDPSRVCTVSTPWLWESFRTTDRKVWLETECKLHGNVDGVSKQLDTDRVASCGNSIVPQIAELIGHRIKEILCQQ
jgi:DNA (cytosine-5)-methyltransferase 1